MNYEGTVTSERTADYGSDLSELDESEQTGRRKWVFIILAILIVGGLGGFYYFGGSGSEAADAETDESQLPAVTVIAPGRTTVEGTITATGTLAARRELPVGVVGEGGRVVSVPVDAGQWVRQGQVLAVIDRSVQNQQAQAQSAQIDVAQSDANLAQANLDRALQLVDRGFISKADVDRLTATRDAAVARVKVAQAQLRELQARNARLSIVAPAAGLLLSRNVEPGQTVSAGSPTLFSIARGGEMELAARVGETDLAQLGAGVVATVTPTGTDKTFSGQIWQISPTIDEQTRQGTARIAIPYAPELRPGGFATARINSGTVVAPILPESSILSDKEGAYVFIIDADNKARRRAVETGMVTSQGVVVTDGLDGSERIVLRAGGFLTDGETVAPQLQDQGSSAR